jgi:hypothetical protein
VHAGFVDRADTPLPSPGLKSPIAAADNPDVEIPGPERPRNARPTVGLDSPCRQCGQPIYYNYKGPIEGVCGKCTDRMRHSARSRHRIRGFASGRGARRRRIGIGLVLAVAAVAAAGYLLLALV